MRGVPGVALVIGVLAALWVGAAGPARAEYPVDYNFFAGIPNELINHGGSLPGSNDWSCKPSAEHPDPVVLAHGTGGGAQTNWGLYAPLLANEGYCVFSLTYGAYDLPWPISAVGGMLPIEQSAVQFGAFVDQVLAATGANKVDVVGHSQGTVMPNYYAKRLGGADKIDKYVSIAPAWQGSNAGGGADMAAFADRLGAGPFFQAAVGSLCQACTELLRDSAFLKDLNSDGVYVPGITYTNIMAGLDEIVVPYSSGFVTGPNATNIVVQDGCASDFSEHLAIAGSPRTARFVLNALDPAHARAVPCEFVPPFTG
ncbi:lipase family protein [Nocardia sp. NBC_00565]|uniref:esterase/lipase family protein n=1 Tax=Nocardia sp. NBC_00565 TaxID=2975993 RepID=UPI002E80AB89|nr:alpha/beta fold hydrolase [Nocardia sp. NBC_00565]WUC01570.1 lipase family protein [Nocardia sp. NBC_00565]